MLENPHWNYKIREYEEIKVHFVANYTYHPATGDIDIDNDAVSWGKCPDDEHGDWYVGDILVADAAKVEEDTLDMIPDSEFMRVPGRCRMTGDATLVYSIDNVLESRDYYMDEDGQISYDAEVDSSDAETEFIPELSSVSNIRITKIGK